MAAIHAVHQCLFCPQTFGSATEKDDHILVHFAQETCTDCNQKLIRIGSNWYTLHNAVTCVKNVNMRAPGHHNASRHVNQPMHKPGTQYTLNSVCYPANFSTFEKTICVDGVQTRPELFKQYEQRGVPINNEFAISHEISNDTESKPMLQVDIIEDDSYLDSMQRYLSSNTHDNNEQQSKKNSARKSCNESDRAECDICGQAMSFKSISNHKKLKHTAPGTHICRNCRKIFPNEDELWQHKTECRTRKKTKKWHKIGESDGSEKATRSTLAFHRHFMCHDPNFMLNHNPGVQKNVIVACEVCGEVMTSELIVKHKRAVHGGPGAHLCKNCGKLFCSKDKLSKHRRECKHEFNKVNEVSCDICGQVMSFKSISNHKKLKHAAPGTPICTICRKVFTNENELSQHKLECRIKKKNR